MFPFHFNPFFNLQRHVPVGSQSQCPLPREINPIVIISFFIRNRKTKEKVDWFDVQDCVVSETGSILQTNFLIYSFLHFHKISLVAFSLIFQEFSFSKCDSPYFWLYPMIIRLRPFFIYPLIFFNSFRDEPSAKDRAHFDAASKEWHLEFLSSPQEILLDDSNNVKGIRVQKNELIEVCLSFRWWPTIF